MLLCRYGSAIIIDTISEFASYLSLSDGFEVISLRLWQLLHFSTMSPSSPSVMLSARTALHLPHKKFVFPSLEKKVISGSSIVNIFLVPVADSEMTDNRITLRPIEKNLVIT